MSRGIIRDADITSVVALRDGSEYRFERTYQSLKVYYRLLRDGKGTGSLTDATHARQTIAYWRERGFIPAGFDTAFPTGGPQ